MTKEQLETNLAALKLLQNETNDKLNDHKVQISLLEKQLEDVNKPELTPQYLDLIQEAIEKAVDGFDFSDTDNYDKEYELDYDGKVSLSHLDLTCSYELVESIVDKVHNLFKEAECPEELDTTEIDNHKPQ
jgi:hypothetical protein